MNQTITSQAVLIREIKTLSANRISEVLDFVGYLKQKDTERKQQVRNCPLCAGYYEPNDETIAAFEEGDAMLRGEKPANWHYSIEDLDKMLGL